MTRQQTEEFPYVVPGAEGELIVFVRFRVVAAEAANLLLVLLDWRMALQGKPPAMALDWGMV